MWLGTQPVDLLMSLRKSQVGDWFLWLLRRRARLRVVGCSMMPTLQPGEEVFIDHQIYHHTLPQVGEIVIAWHPHQPGLKVIKRVAVVNNDGCCVLLGDNYQESIDSRRWGAIAPNHILGRVVCRC
jgi:nickel-type superoxide dismutase maturation protease